MFSSDVLPSNQGKDSNAKRQQCQKNGWYSQAKRLQAIEKKEQDQTPGSDRAGHSHFHSPLVNT
jgi:hypothetical protein